MRGKSVDVAGEHRRDLRRRSRLMKLNVACLIAILAGVAIAVPGVERQRRALVPGASLYGPVPTGCVASLAALFSSRMTAVL